MVATLDIAMVRRLFLEDEPEGLGWVAWLSPRNMRLFAVELNAALAAPDSERIAALLESWQATAELDHTPEVQDEIHRNRAMRFAPVDEWLNNRRTA